HALGLTLFAELLAALAEPAHHTVRNPRDQAERAQRNLVVQVGQHDQHHDYADRTEPTADRGTLDRDVERLVQEPHHSAEHGDRQNQPEHHQHGTQNQVEGDHVARTLDMIDEILAVHPHVEERPQRRRDHGLDHQHQQAHDEEQDHDVGDHRQDVGMHDAHGEHGHQQQADDRDHYP